MNFQSRIATHYMFATAIIMATIFVTVFFIVKSNVYFYIDQDLHFEAEKHNNEVSVVNHNVFFSNNDEWEEREHNEIQVNPVFIQLIDKDGNVKGRSPNLKYDTLIFIKHSKKMFLDASLHGKSVRQIQYPIYRVGKLYGFIIAAISAETAELVLLKLRNTLLISFIIVLTGLYFISRFIASRSILPVKKMTKTINRISKNNLSERVEVPENRDEIHDLSLSFNHLLQRIEDTLVREKQFTSNASHELRTPLASLRGTLEVLIRKPRTSEEYLEKVKFSLQEIDKMANIIDQLLLLAQIENNEAHHLRKNIPITEVINEVLSQKAEEIQQKRLHISTSINDASEIEIPYYYGKMIFSNLISNAIKYSHPSGEIDISTERIDHAIAFHITDHGLGIRKEDLDNIFKSFFRSNPLEHKSIPGNGLGLSIVKKAVDTLNASISVKSELHKGTQFTVIFK